MQSNSLGDVLNSSAYNSSKSGGLLLGGGNISGGKGTTEIFNIDYSGFFTGFTISSGDLNSWEPLPMDKEDSVRSAEANWESGRGANPIEFKNYLDENQ